MSKIYIAASWPRIGEARARADRLRLAGFHVTSTWHDVEHPEEPSDERCREWAERDLEELAGCDTVYCLTGDDQSIGGGRHSEIGAAIALGKRVVLLGPREKNVFHWHPLVEVIE